MKINNLLPLIAAISVLFGCVSRTEKPFLYDKTTYPERVEVNKNNWDEVVKVSYMANALMENDNRAEIIKKVTNSDLVKEWNSAQTATVAQMSTDLAVGQFNSGVGVHVATAVFAADVLLGEFFDGSEDFATSAWLPKTYNGQELNTERQAQAALVDLSIKRAQKVAKTLGWETTCVYGCDSKRIIMHFKNTQDRPLHADYIYKPTEFAIQISFNSLVKIDVQDPINALMGEPLSWKTNGNNSYFVKVLSGLVHDENGGLKFTVNENNGQKYILSYRNMGETHLGRDILRTYHSTPYTFFGSNDQYPSVIYYNGMAYTFLSNSNTYIASHYLDESYLLDGKAPVTTPVELHTQVVDGY